MAFDIDQALRYVVEHEGSDLHVKVASTPMVRVHGVLQPIPGTEALTSEDTEQALGHILHEPALLADFAEGPLFDWYTAGRSTITVDDVEPWLRALSRTGSAPDWSAAVRTRVGRALLATLRDFGVLEGVASGTRKVIGHPYPSVPGFAYTCWRLHELGVTAASLEASSVWRRWLLGPADVGALMTDLARHEVILLNRAGSVTRIEWRATTLAEAVHAAA